MLEATELSSLEEVLCSNDLLTVKAALHPYIHPYNDLLTVKAPLHPYIHPYNDLLTVKAAHPAALHPYFVVYRLMQTLFLHCCEASSRRHKLLASG